MAFAAVKKVVNDDCLESLNTKNLGGLCNSLKLKASGAKRGCYKDCYHLKMTRLCSTTE